MLLLWTQQLHIAFESVLTAHVQVRRLNEHVLFYAYKSNTAFPNQKREYIGL
jgi:hypothetical protein